MVPYVVSTAEARMRDKGLESRKVSSTDVMLSQGLSSEALSGRAVVLCHAEGIRLRLVTNLLVPLRQRRQGTHDQRATLSPATEEEEWRKRIEES